MSDGSTRCANGFATTREGTALGADLGLGLGAVAQAVLGHCLGRRDRQAGQLPNKIATATNGMAHKTLNVFLPPGHRGARTAWDAGTAWDAVSAPVFLFCPGWNAAASDTWGHFSSRRGRSVAC